MQELSCGADLMVQIMTPGSIPGPQKSLKFNIRIYEIFKQFSSTTMLPFLYYAAYSLDFK